MYLNSLQDFCVIVNQQIALIFINHVSCQHLFLHFLRWFRKSAHGLTDNPQHHLVRATSDRGQPQVPELRISLSLTNSNGPPRTD